MTDQELRLAVYDRVVAAHVGEMNVTPGEQIKGECDALYAWITGPSDVPDASPAVTEDMVLAGANALENLSGVKYRDVAFHIYRAMHAARPKRA